MQEQPSSSDGHGQIIRFRPRGASPGGWRWPMRPREDPPVADLSKYERGSDDDDYFHRMKMNVLTVVVTVTLMGIGIWLAVSIVEVRQVQDCLLQGRINCAPVKIPPREP